MIKALLTSPAKRHLILGGVLLLAAMVSFAMLPHAVGMVILHGQRDSYQPIVRKILGKEQGRFRGRTRVNLEILDPATSIPESIRVSRDIYEKVKEGEEMAFRYNPNRRSFVMQNYDMRMVSADAWPAPYHVYRMIAWYLVLVSTVIWWLRRQKMILEEASHRVMQEREARRLGWKARKRNAPDPLRRRFRVK